MSADGHDSNVAHHFDDIEQQFDTNKFGMWVFLLTEILFFTALFVAYSTYRNSHPDVFKYASRFLDTNLGAVNTIVLLFSSLTAAWAVRAAQLGQRGLVTKLLIVTIMCAAGFMATSASKKVIYAALVGNSLIAVTKFAAATATGSATSSTRLGASWCSRSMIAISSSMLRATATSSASSPIP